MPHAPRTVLPTVAVIAALLLAAGACSKPAGAAATAPHRTAQLEVRGSPLLQGAGGCYQSWQIDGTLDGCVTAELWHIHDGEATLATACELRTEGPPRPVHATLQLAVLDGTPFGAKSERRLDLRLGVAEPAGITVITPGPDVLVPLPTGPTAWSSGSSADMSSGNGADASAELWYELHGNPEQSSTITPWELQLQFLKENCRNGVQSWNLVLHTSPGGAFAGPDEAKSKRSK